MALLFSANASLEPTRASFRTGRAVNGCFTDTALLLNAGDWKAEEFRGSCVVSAELEFMKLCLCCGVDICWAVPKMPEALICALLPLMEEAEIPRLGDRGEGLRGAKA